jgi:hypothetical protein
MRIGGEGGGRVSCGPCSNNAQDVAGTCAPGQPLAGAVLTTWQAGLAERQPAMRQWQMCRSGGRARDPAGSGPAMRCPSGHTPPAGAHTPPLGTHVPCCPRLVLTQFTLAPAKLSMYWPAAQSWQCPGSSQSDMRGSSKSPARAPRACISGTQERGNAGTSDGGGKKSGGEGVRPRLCARSKHSVHVHVRTRARGRLSL